LVLPATLCCRIENRICGSRSNRCFIALGQFFSLLPGLSGQYLRRAFYCGTLQRCCWDCKIGFGAIFSQREAIVERGVYIGTYALLGHVALRDGCLIGSRASIISSGQAHELDASGKWTPFDPSRVRITEVGRDAWVGEGALVAANVGSGAMVSAGSVVGSPVPAGIMVAGNPARFVRRLIPADTNTQPGETVSGVLT
jgi:acetyltransferase-like isoleucine patch superfamily enzyme